MYYPQSSTVRNSIYILHVMLNPEYMICSQIPFDATMSRMGVKVLSNAREGQSMLPAKRDSTYIHLTYPFLHQTNKKLHPTYNTTNRPKNEHSSHQWPSLTSVVICSPSASLDGNFPVFAWCSRISSFSSHCCCSQASNSSRVARGMEETLKRRQCMWMGGGWPSM